MNERGKKLQPKLALDMPFDEALARFLAVTPSELNEAIEKAKTTAKPGIKKPKRKPKGDPDGA